MSSTPPDSPDQTARRLTELLREQLDVYGKVLDLGTRQTELIGSGDTEGLMQLLTSKQKLIARVGDLAKRAAPLQAACEEHADDLSPDVRDDLEQTIASLRETLAAIVKIEDEGQNALTGARDKAGGKIAQMQKGKLMNKAYGGGKKPPPTARFKDKNG